MEVVRDVRGSAEESLREAASWLERAKAVRESSSGISENVALTVHSYAIVADVHVRIAELRAALDGDVLAAVETHESRRRALAYEDVERRRERRESGGPIPRDV